MTKTNIAELLDTAGIDAAAERLAHANRHLAEMRRVAAEADGECESLRGLLPSLVEDVAHGRRELSAAEVVDVHHRGRDALAFATAAGAVVRRVEALVAGAEAALREVRGNAWQAVLQHGAGLRIQAGAMMDLARAGRSGTTMADEARHARRMDEASLRARPLFDEGSRLVNLAVENGARMPTGAGWLPEWQGLTESRERRHWGLPPGTEDSARAA